MFNRQPFNRGKFNGPVSTGRSNISGYATFKLSVNSVMAHHDLSAKAEASFKLGTYADNYSVIYAQGVSVMTLGGSLIPTKLITGQPRESSLTMDSYGRHSLHGESMIKFTDRNGLPLVLRPGDELVIDTCEMTVTVNGINQMRYTSQDSDFFNLLRGNNEIVYTDGSSSRRVSIDILWKDRWV